MSEYDNSPHGKWGGTLPYECLRCGETTMGENMEERDGEIKCVACGYRVLKKTKPPVVKRVLAR